MNCPLFRKVLVVFPCSYSQWAGGIVLEMGLQWLCSAQGHHTLPSRPLAALTQPTPCQGKLDCSLRHKRAQDSPSAMCTGLLGMEQSLGTVGAAPSQVSPGHCPGCADAPGELSASPISAHPKELAWHSLQEKVGCVFSLGHEPQSQHFGAGFPPLTPTHCMT